MISKGAAFISFRRWIGALLPCRGENGFIPRFPSTAAKSFRRMLWLRLTGNTLPPGISSRLKRLTAPAIALKEPTGLDPRSVDFINAEAQALPGEEAEKPRSQMRCVPT